VIYPAPELAASTRWWSELLGVQPYFEEPFYVGDGIVTGSVRTPGGAILGFIYNPHLHAGAAA
jgi:hypothetical protein